MGLVYSEKIPAAERSAFEAKVIEVSKKLSIDPNWLMQVMKAESNLDPGARNTTAPFKDGFATGLIQFIPSTARGLGTTTDALAIMDRVSQMDYVYLYLKPYAGKLRSYFDLYLVIFFPAAIGKPDSYVFETKTISRASIAKSNPAININKDGEITMAEFKQYLKNTVPKQNHEIIFGAALGASLLLVLAGVGFLILKFS